MKIIAVIHSKQKLTGGPLFVFLTLTQYVHDKTPNYCNRNHKCDSFKRNPCIT